MTLTYPALGPGRPAALAGHRGGQAGAAPAPAGRRPVHPGRSGGGRPLADPGRPQRRLTRVGGARAGSAGVGDAAVLDRPPPADEDVRDHGRREEAVLDHARGSTRAVGQGGRVVHLAPVVGDDTAVGAGAARRAVDRAEPAQGGGRARRPAARAGPAASARSTGLVESAITTKRAGRRGDDLLPGVGRTPALDQPSVGGDLVGPVDGEVEAGRGPRTARSADPRARAAASVRAKWPRTARESPGRPAPAAGRQRSTGAQADGHAVLDQVGGRLGRQLLLRSASRTLHRGTHP